MVYLTTNKVENLFSFLFTVYLKPFNSLPFKVLCLSTIQELQATKADSA